MERAMFCRQCEQAAQSVGCEVMGNCGKNPEVAALPDLMIHWLRRGLPFMHTGPVNWGRRTGRWTRSCSTVFSPG